MGKLVKETNVTFDTSRVEGSGEVGRLLEGRSWSGNPTAIPADRFLFGSHAPYFPVEANLIKLFESPLSLDQMTAIMNANARRLLESV
jgi:predicted TIM-barrel fold metal-dependent hydrolase